MSIIEKYRVGPIHEWSSYPDILQGDQVIELLTPNEKSKRMEWRRILQDALYRRELIPANEKNSFVRFEVYRGIPMGFYADGTGQVIIFHKDVVRIWWEKEGGAAEFPSDCCISRWWGERHSAIKASATSQDETNPLTEFQNMDGLRANEISLRFLFNNRMEISARGVKRKLSCGSLDLLNKTSGNLNKQGALLLGFAQGKKPPKTEGKTVSRVRGILKKYLGVKTEPFQTDWTPHFTISDNRDAPDKRAAKDAKLVAYNDDALSHVDKEYTFDQDDDDIASEWLEQHD